MIPNRIDRISQLFQTEISQILERYQEYWASFGAGFLFTVTRVEVEKNLEHAYVYYSWTTPGPDFPVVPNADTEWEKDEAFRSRKAQVERVLDSIRPAVSRELVKRVDLRRFPRIQFVHDLNLEGGSRIHRILEGLSQERLSEKEPPKRRKKK